MGDSITEITCWRALVWDNLVAANVSSQIQFVGSSTTNTQNCKAKDPSWDHHHEGHSGYLAINIANTNLVGWLAPTKPDIVMFMLGTNDVAQGRTTDAIIAAYTKMVGEMRAANAAVKIIVSITPSRTLEVRPNTNFVKGRSRHSSPFRKRSHYRTQQCYTRMGHGAKHHSITNIYR